MKRIIQISTAVLLCLLSISSCEKERLIGHTELLKNCISIYYPSTGFEAKCNTGSYYYAPSTGEHTPSIIIRLSDDIRLNDGINFRKDPTQHAMYAERYHDVSFNRYWTAPYLGEALAEPLKAIECFEIATNDGQEKRINISDKVQYYGSTYLPYIRSGYNDELLPNPKRGYSHEILGRPLLKLTQEDLTLMDVDRPIELIATPPYCFPKEVLVVIHPISGAAQDLLVSITK